MVGSMRMQKNMKLEPLLQLRLNKIIGRRQPTKKLTLIRNSSTKKSLKKERGNGAWIMKEAHYHITGRGKSKIMAEKTNNSLVFTRRIARPAFETVLYLLQPLLGCATIQDLNFPSFVAVTVMIVAAALLAVLFRYIKLWKWLAMNQFKAKRCVRDKQHDEENSSKKWRWIEGLVPDASDDFYISIFIVVGLGILCGILLLIRRFNSKNVRK